jgi:DNA polymerase III sliding clamp (beta) subunit (PCNA family)
MSHVAFDSDDLRAAMEILHIAASKVTTSEDGFAKMQIVFDPKQKEHVAGFVVGRTLVTQFAAPCQAKDEFSTLVPVDILHDLLKAPPAKTIELAAKDGKIHIVSGSYKARFAIPQTSTISFVPRFQPDIEFPNATAFNDLLVRVYSAIFTEAAATANAAQRVLDGAMFRSSKGSLRVVATDNNRISRVEMPCSVDTSFVVDRQAVASMQQIFRVEADKLLVKIEHGAVTLRCGHALIKVPRLAGDPPSVVDAVFETAWTDSATLESAVFLKALRRVKRVASDRVVQVDITPDAMRLASVSATGARIGDAEETIATQATGTFSFKVFSDYLADATKESSSVRLWWKDANTPAMIEHVNCAFHTRHVIGLMRW